jgi:hypothetical protein
MPLWGGPAAAEDIVAWCRTLTDELRARDGGGRPIGTGDGIMAGFPSRRLAPLVDYVAPHIYYGDSDPMRQALCTDFQLRAAQTLGRPVLLEEFGCSRTHAGEREQAAYHREALHAAFGLGCSGALAWCWTDFDPATLGLETPYVHHAFELGFGLVRADGSEKPVCDEWRAFRRFLDSADLANRRPERPRAALVRSSWLDEDVPFSWQDREAMARTLVQAYVLAVQAGLDPAVVGEDDEWDGYTLLLCPATQKLRTPTWARLEAAARAGATVYWSYFSGDHAFHQGMWCPSFEALTGLRHRLRYGCFDLVPEQLALRGDVTLTVPTGVARTAAPYPLARLPIEPGPSARVLATDGEGRPALTEQALDAGRLLFCAYPIERYLANLPDGSARDAYRLYRLLGERAGVEQRYPTRHPDVHSRVVEVGADDLVVVQHRGWRDAVDDATLLPRGAEVLLDRSGRTDGALGPKGTRIYRVRARG